jgi:hypothetical protein
MKLSRIVIRFCLIIMSLLNTTLSAQPTPPHTDDQWAQFLHKCDYRVDGQIPTGFFHGAFIGDGVSGAMIYRDAADPAELRWLMGRYDITAHQSLPKLEYCTPRLFAGDILLRPAGKIATESLRMNLWDGEASGEFKTDKGELRWRSYVHRGSGAFVVVLDSTGGEDAAAIRVREQWGVSPIFAHNKADPAQYERQDLLPPRPQAEMRGDVTLITQPLPNPRAAHAVASTVIDVKPGTRVLLVTLGAARRASGTVDEAMQAATSEALQRLEKVRTMSLAELDASHRKWWHAYMRQSRLELPDDPKWQAYWWQQIYKFASASAEDSAWLIDTQGPWTYVGAWTAVWWNLNIQLSYYPAMSANRLNVGRSLFNGVDRLARSGTLNANAGKHAADSIWIGRSSDQWGRSAWGDEYGNLTWVLHTLWRYWRHSGDDQIGRRVFELLKQDVAYYLHNVVHEGPDGRLHLKPTRSPEFEELTRGEATGKRELYPDANFAVASLHWALQSLIELDAHFGLNDPERARWEEVRRKLVSPPAGENGLKIGGDQEYIGSHRHYSHLLAIYPYHLINPDQGPEAAALIRKSVDHWTSKPRAFAGYSYTGACAMYATLGDAETAISWLDKLLPRSEPNSLYKEGGGQVIETPLSAVESLNYLLLQSWGGTVRVFPAVPKRWANASFTDFLAEGAFAVSAERREGATVRVEVRSIVGNPLRLKLDRPIEEFEVHTSQGTEVKVESGLLHANLKPGETVTLSRRPAARASTFSPAAFGARGDGVTLDTPAFQAAIDAAHAAGGGTVVVPAGSFVVGTLHLKSRVMLHIPRGSTLLGSTSQADYARPPRWPGYAFRETEHISHALILAVEQEDVGVSGEGTIDGRGRQVVDDVRRFYPGETHPDHGGQMRPMILQFVRCRGVRVTDVTLRDAAFWVQCYSECDGVYVRGITVRSHAWWNNDGIDVADSRRVRISDCDIDSADDAICLKSDRFPVEDVVITNCVVRTWANAFKCGTLSGGGFKNITVSNLSVDGAGHSGLALECVDGGTLQNVTLQNIAMRNIRHAIFIRIGARLRANAQCEMAGELKGVLISNVIAEVHPGDPDAGEPLAAPKAKYPHNSFPCIVAGLPDFPVCDVTFNNVQLTLPGGGSPEVASVALADVPENPRSYPEYNCLGELPASAFFIRHARRIAFRDVRVTLQKPDFREPVVVDDVDAATSSLAGVSVRVATSESAIRPLSATTSVARTAAKAVLREVSK